MILESYITRQSMASDISSMNLPAGGGMVSHNKEPQDILKAYIEKGRPIKQLFNKYADHEFMRSLSCIHYANIENLKSLNKQVTSRDELSAVAWKRGERFVFGNPMGGDQSKQCGVLLKGHITLLANDSSDIVSGRGDWYSTHLPDRTRDSGANKGVSVIPSVSDIVGPKAAYVLSEDDWNPKQNSSGARLNEALVDNWKISMIIAPNEEVEEQLRSMMMNGIINRTFIVSPSYFQMILSR